MVFAIVVYDLRRHAFPYLEASGREWLAWAAALATTILFFGSVLLHELAHSFVAKRRGISVSRITLFIFGGVAQVEEEPKGPRDEFLISVAGPAMSVLLGVAFAGAYALAKVYPGLLLVAQCLHRVSVVNFALAIFNMVPGFPLDGGRVLRSLLWLAWGDILRATRVASILGQIVGYMLAGLGAYMGAMSGSLLIGLFYVGMGLLLATVARATYRRERVRFTLNSLPLWRLTVPAEMTFQKGTALSVAAPHYFTYQPKGLVPILHADELLGVLAGSQIRHIPHAQWPWVAVEDVMEPLREDLVIRASRPAYEALEHIMRNGQASVIVVDDWGRMQGVVTHGGLSAALGAMLG